jgi:hypothetical protein
MTHADGFLISLAELWPISGLIPRKPGPAKAIRRGRAYAPG